MDEEGEERRAKQFPKSPPVTVYFTKLVVLAFGRCYVIWRCYVMLCLLCYVKHDYAVPGHPGLEAGMARRLFLDSYDEEDEIACEDCDAGAACNICLVLVLQDDCPASIDAFQHMLDADGLAVHSLCIDIDEGEVCEGSGECGTDDGADNCLGLADIYRSVNCYGDFLFQPPPLPSPPLPSPPSPPRQPAASTALGRVAASTSTAVDPGASQTANSVLIVVGVAGALLLVTLAFARKRLYHAWRVQRQGAVATNLISGGALSGSIINQGGFAPGGVEASCELGVLPPLEGDGDEIAGNTRALPSDPLAHSRI